LALDLVAVVKIPKLIERQPRRIGASESGIFITLRNVTGSPIIVGAVPQKENSSSSIRAIILPLRAAEGRLKSFPINCSVEIGVKQRTFSGAFWSKWKTFILIS
jgi:hypothetical protein